MIGAQQQTRRESAWPSLAWAYAIFSCTVAVALARSNPYALIHTNAVLLLLWATTTAVAASCAGQWWVHHRFDGFDFVRHNEVGGFIVAIVGSLYGVLLGFMTVIAWQHFSDSRLVVAQETAAATDAWHTSVGLPYAVRVHVRQDMLRYSNAMVEREWPAMRQQSYDKGADFIVMDAIAAAGSFNPAGIREGNAQNATLQQLSALHDYRWRRLSESSAGISSFEWLVLLIGGACIVGFCWIFGLENENVHLVMTSTVAIIVASTLVLLFELQFPFQTDLRISSDAWSGAVSHLQTMQQGAVMGMRM
jgi:hypothetical protein